MKLSVNVFLTCIIFLHAGPGCDKTVRKQWADSYHGYRIICPRMFFS